MLIGKILDQKYEIIELIGQGGMALVYKAKDLRLDRFVAVKVLKNEFADNEQFLKKFLREAQADAKLMHPNIVNVYDVGISDDLYYIVMEYIDGNTLKKYIRDNRFTDYAQIVNILIMISEGLAHAHQNNIIHRDIKPHNILMTSSQIPKVADFGIARAITSSTVTATEEALGSVHYISPEQARGAFLDERSDLYSLGVMMFEMLVGELPYDGETPVAVALKHVQNDVPAPKEVREEVPDNLNQIVLNLTRRKPDDRYQNADDLIRDLRRVSLDPNAVIAPTYEVSGVEKTGSEFSPAKKISANKSGKHTPLFRNKRFLAGFFTFLLVFSVLAYIGIGKIFGDKVVVPDVQGMTIQEAALELAKVGLEYKLDRDNSDEYEKDVVIRQTPEADARIRTSEIVTLVVSLGPETANVPDVTEMTQEEAEQALKDQGFTVKEFVYQFSDEYEKGIVFDQNPSANIDVAIGTEITLYVSNGVDVVTMPKAKGLTLDAARTVIEEADLVVGNVTYQASDTVEKGIVLSQSVSMYSEVARNSSVDLVVSLGKETTKTLLFDLTPYGGGSEKITVEITLSDSDGSNVKTVYKDDVNLNAQSSISVSVTGSGTKKYTLYVDGKAKETGDVEF